MNRTGFLFFILFLLSAVLPCRAQQIEGIVRNSAGQTVEYVSIGINGKNVGTVSGSDGRFCLTVPDSLDDRELSFSHISHGNLSLPVYELKRRCTAEGGLNLTLPDSPFEIRPVVVRKKQPRMRRLYSAGIPFPNGSVSHCIPSNRRDSTQNPRLAGEEFGVVLHTDRPTWIKEVSFTVLSNSFDTLIFRIGIYKIEADSSFTPLIRKPFYIDIDKTNERTDYICDISEYDACAEGNLYMGIEIVQDSRRGCVSFPCHMKAMYYRNISKGSMSKELFSPGIRIRGVYLD